eukprot:11225602-Lingulodinium_polyedra.AAC.1
MLASLASSPAARRDLWKPCNDLDRSPRTHSAADGKTWGLHTLSGVLPVLQKNAHAASRGTEKRTGARN